MRTACALLLLAGFYPLSLAWSANRRTTLRDALLWAAWAWLTWLLVVAGRITGTAGPLGSYLALALTGCAGVAVLGARRPVVGAWNFVVLGLLAVLLLPVVPRLLGLGEAHLETAHLIFLGIVLGILVVNYLPTRLGLGALLLGAGCAIEFAVLAGVDVGGFREVAPWLIAVSPWAALLGVGWGLAPASELDRVWRAFRDRFGLFWGERQREQFNRAAGNAGWPLSLGWGGVRRTGAGEAPEPAGPLETLHAVLKRFGPPAPEDR